jgi:hypothetical protein
VHFTYTVWHAERAKNDDTLCVAKKTGNTLYFRHTGFTERALILLFLLWMLKSSAKSRLALSWTGEFGVCAKLQDWLALMSAVEV